MARYKLTKPSYLGTRYHAEGSVVDWDGPPNKAMEPMDGPAKDRHAEYLAAQKAKRETARTREAREVPQPAGDPPDPTWAPQPRPAFSVKTLRNIAPDHVDDDQSSIVREPAGAPSASAPPSAIGQDAEKDDAPKTTTPMAKPADTKSSAAPKVVMDDKRK